LESCNRHDHNGRFTSVIRQALLNAAKAAHADTDVKVKLEALGLEISDETGPEFAADIRKQAARWARLVEAAGFKANDGNARAPQWSGCGRRRMPGSA
jgi:hypothetical protein